MIADMEEVICSDRKIQQVRKQNLRILDTNGSKVLGR